MRTRAGAIATSIAWTALAVGTACDKSSEQGPQPSAAALASPSDTRVTVGEHGFAPASLVLPKGPAGSTVPITFLRTTDATCAKEVVFPDLGIKKELPLNEPVTVDVPTDTSRALTFQCGMAMYKGAVVVK
jgi:plastocyanin domain-containing protein